MVFTKILVIYPQETTTRIAIYKNVNLVFLKDIRHKVTEICAFKKISDQYQYRLDSIINELKENEIDCSELKLVIARGGLIKAVKSGVYEVNERMKEDLRKGIMGEHAINLGGLLADGMAKTLPDGKAYIADPVVVDEMADIAKVAGHPLFERRSIFHALNHKFISRKYARSASLKYEDLNIIVTHVGDGGISVGAHCKGQVIDVNNAFDGDGPFSINRAGTLPVGDLVRLCFSGKYTKEQVLDMISRHGGLYAHLGTKSIDEIDRRISEGDEKARFIMQALAYQISKEIGAMYTVLKGEVDAIIFTGEIFNIQEFTNYISEHVDSFGKIVVFPLVDDMDSLANDAVMLLRGETEVLEYL